MNNFCTMPFNSLEISPDGTCKVCCKIKTNIKKTYKEDFNVLNDKIEDIWQSISLKELRSKFLRNEKPEECKLCWTEEESNVKSLRLQTQLTKIDKETPKVTYLSLKLSNKCNLACRICSPQLSSLWQAHFKKLQLPLEPTKMFKTVDLEKFQDDRIESLYRLSLDLNHLLIYGGEPLINDEVIDYLKYLVRSDISKNIQLTLNTNGTVFSEEIISLFSNFKVVDLFLSIDDINQRFEYQRWPAKWTKIDNNIKNYAKLNSDKFRIEFYPSLSILNILTLDEFLSEISKYGIPITFNNIIHDPGILNIKNLPKELKEKVYKIIDDIDFEKFNFNKNYDIPKDAILNFLSLPNDPEIDTNLLEYRHSLKNYMDIHDNFRTTPMKEYLPELWRLIYED